MSELTTYLSVVVTARNDDHGGNLLSRMQAFVNGWIGQCRRHELSSELIVVDWNPPADRPPLIHALKWPAETYPCEVRFIRVPPETHQRYQHAEALPLYQMIAKNAGIRRARGRFVLATNIDIIFSDELVEYLAKRCLDPGRMYRIDRHDVMSDVPVEAGVEEQLAYCRTHLIRVNAREGTFKLTQDGLRALSSEDIASGDSGVTFGAGWYGAELESPRRPFRWVANNAEVVIQSYRPHASFLSFELEPGPSAGGGPLLLRAVDSGGRVLAETELRRRTHFTVKIRCEDVALKSFRLQLSGGGLPVPNDPRILNLRVFSCAWAISREAAARDSSATSARNLWLTLMHVITRLAQEDSPVQFDVPVSPWVQRLAEFYLGVGGFTGLFRGGVRRYRESRRARGSLFPADAARVPSAEFLHTNACGDFTLLARERWIDLRGYPEFDMFSFNIDSVFCYAAHHGGAPEEVLQEPMRIYHIEHGSGSGWTPEGQARLFDRLRTKGIPWLENQELIVWAEQMRRSNSPFIFNHESWGLADLELTETVPGGQANRTATV